MKNLSIFDVQDINTLLNQNDIDYILKIKDTCGNQAISLECVGKKTDIDTICKIINIFLKKKHLQVRPGKINPLQLQVY
jgi:hypothetical protein